VYRIYPQHNLLAKSYSGILTIRCVLDVLDALELDPAFREGMFELDDLRFIDEFALSPDEVRKLAGLIKGLNTRRRQATRRSAVSSDPTVLRAAAVYMRELEGLPQSNIRVFDHLVDALEFLDISNPQLACEIDAMAPEHPTG